MMYHNNYSRALMAALALVALSACSASGEGSDPLPNDAQIQIDPSQRTFDITENLNDDGLCQADGELYIDQYVTVSVRNGNGAPIGGAELTMSVDFGGNSFGSNLPFDFMELYDDINSNGVVDGPGELVSGTDDSLFRTATAEFTGEKNVILRLNLSCSYRGSLNVFSDGFMGVADFTIQDAG